ncbi:hypothetical protein ACLAI4_06400 [Klebsiella pneumoniae]|uniref:hypothetical protein n=1 Tax=Klebsiella pneumoniae TaxID=573 RepID=UPI0039859F16
MKESIFTNKCEKFSIVSIMVLCFFGATYTAKFLVISETSILELLFFLSSIFVLGRYGINRNALLISVISIGYLVYSLVTVLLITNANLLDFIQAYKSYYYLILLGCFYKKRIFSEKAILNLFNYILLVYLLKYCIDKYVLGIERPTVLIENNFELILVILLYYLNNIIKRSPQLLQTFLMIILCFVSGSRSSFVALIIAIFFSLDKNINFRKAIILMLVPLAGIIMLIVFQQRLELSGGSSYEGIDRYRFFLEFLSSTSQWEWWQFLTGSTALTPLSPMTCSNLGYYSTLFSYAGDGKCYSVILHSFILRVIYDHGFIGFMFLLFGIVFYLNKFNLKHKLCIILILLATALSVSSLNNVYVAFSLIFFIGSTVNYRESNEKMS